MTGNYFTDNLQIRAYQPQDTEALLQLVKASFDEHLLSETNDDGRDYFFSFVHQVLVSDSTSFVTWVALIDASPVGILSLRDATHLCLFFTASHFLNRGVGRRLLAAVERQLWLVQPDGFTLTVNSSLFAVNIYRRLGFTPSGDVAQQRGLSFRPLQKRVTPPLEC